MSASQMVTAASRARMRGAEDSFEAAFPALFRQAFHLAWRILGSRAAAEDVAAEALARAPSQGCMGPEGRDQPRSRCCPTKASSCGSAGSNRRRGNGNTSRRTRNGTSSPAAPAARDDRTAPPRGTDRSGGRGRARPVAGHRQNAPDPRPGHAPSASRLVGGGAKN